MKFFKAGSGSTQNHVLEMQEVTGPGSERFVVGRAQLVKALGRHREVTRLLADPAGGAADERLATVSHAILHDAVLSVAMV